MKNPYSSALIALWCLFSGFVTGTIFAVWFLLRWMNET